MDDRPLLRQPLPPEPSTSLPTADAPYKPPSPPPPPLLRQPLPPDPSTSLPTADAPYKPPSPPPPPLLRQPLPPEPSTSLPTADAPYKPSSPPPPPTKTTAGARQGGVERENDDPVTSPPPAPYNPPPPPPTKAPPGARRVHAESGGPVFAGTIPPPASAPYKPPPPPPPPPPRPPKRTVTGARQEDAQENGMSQGSTRSDQDQPPAAENRPVMPPAPAPSPTPKLTTVILKRIFHRRSQNLPVINPPPNKQSFKHWYRSCQGDVLPDGVMQVRIAVCGFAVYGIMALLSNTWELVKDFSENEKVIVLFCIGLIWTVATVTVPVTMSGRTRADHSLSDHATRFVLLGVTLHMIFNLSLMLPTNFWVKGLKANSWLIVAFVLLLCIAIIGHGVTWILYTVFGEVERETTQETRTTMVAS